MKMGLFDIVYVFMRCPYCNNLSSLEAQTHDLAETGRGSLNEYKTVPEIWVTGKKPENKKEEKDESLKDLYDVENELSKAKVREGVKHKDFIEVTVSCESPICQLWANERDRRTQGVASGFGRLFEGKIKITDGYLVGKVYDINLINEELPERQSELEPIIKGSYHEIELRLLKDLVNNKIKFPDVRDEKDGDE